MGGGLPFYLRGFFFSIYILYKMCFIVIIPYVHKVFIFFTCIALSYPPIPYPSLSEDVQGCVPVFPCWLQKRASSVPNHVPSAVFSPSLFVPWTLQMREHVMITIFLVRLTSLHKIALVPSIFLQVTRLCSFFFLP